eukprot:g12449.t1
MSAPGLTTLQTIRLEAEQGKKFRPALFKNNPTRAILKGLWDKYVAEKKASNQINGDQMPDAFERLAYANSLFDISETGLLIEAADHEKIMDVLTETRMESLKEIARVNVTRADLKDCKATGRMLGEEKEEDKNRFDELARQFSGSATGTGLHPKKVALVSDRAKELNLDGLAADFLPTQDQANQLKAQMERGVAFPYADLKQKPWHPKRADWIGKVGLSECEVSDQLKDLVAAHGVDGKLAEKQMVTEMAVKAKRTEMPITQYSFLLEKFVAAYVIASEDDDLDKNFAKIATAYRMAVLDAMNLYGPKTVMMFDIDVRQAWAEESRAGGFKLLEKVKDYKGKKFDEFISLKRQRDHDEHNKKQQEDAKRRKQAQQTEREKEAARRKNENKGKYGKGKPTGGRASGFDQNQNTGKSTENSWGQIWNSWGADGAGGGDHSTHQGQGHSTGAGSAQSEHKGPKGGGGSSASASTYHEEDVVNGRAPEDAVLAGTAASVLKHARYTRSHPLRVLDHISGAAKRRRAQKFTNYEYIDAETAAVLAPSIPEISRGLALSCFAGPERANKRPAYLRDDWSSDEGADEWTDEEDYNEKYSAGVAQLDSSTPGTSGAKTSSLAPMCKGRQYKESCPEVLHLAQQGLFMSIDASNIEEHVAAARRFKFPQVSHEPLPLDLQEAVVFTADAVPLRQAARRAVLQYWRGRKQELRVKAWDPGRALITRVEVNLMAEMMRVTGIYGEKLKKRLELGFPVVGIFDEPTAFPRTNRRRPIKSIADLVASRERVLQEIERITAREDAEEGQAIWDSLVGECESGSLRGPYCLDDEEDVKNLPREFLPLRRFIVTQQSYSGALKCYRVKQRPCDNAKRSRLNDGCAVRTPNQTMRGDELNAAVLFLMRLLGPLERLSHVKKDMEKAYRQLLALLAHHFVVVVAKCPEDGKLYGAVALALLFGEEASVIDFNVYALTAAALGRRLLRIPLVPYFDDFANPTREEDTKLCASDLDEFFSSLLGITFSAEKDETGRRIRFLGVFHSVQPGGITNEICPVRAEELRGRIGTALSSNCLPPRAAEQLAGALNFCCRSGFGRLGRAFLVPIYGRAHCVHKGGQLGVRLRRSLEWFCKNIHGLRFGIPTAVPAPPVVIYTDASGPGLLGIVVLDGDKAAAASCWSPRAAEKLQIEFYETEAVSVALEKFASAIRGRKVLAILDNESAQGATQKGHSTDDNATDVIHGIWSKALALGIDLWFERVGSKLNVADGPPSMALDAQTARRRDELIKALQNQPWFDARFILSFRASQMTLTKRLREALLELQKIELAATREERVDAMRRENDMCWSVDEAIRLLSENEGDEIEIQKGERLTKKLKTLQGTSAANQATALDRRADLLMQNSIATNTRTGYISALKQYQKFCQTRGTREFPVQFAEVRRWISLANTSEAATGWLSALKKACVLLRAPFEWSQFEHLELATIINGIKKIQPSRRISCAILGPHLLLILNRAEEMEQLEMRLLLGTTYVLALRMKSEALPLLKASDAIANHDAPSPKMVRDEGKHSALFVKDGKLMCILAKRKTRQVDGDVISRACFCNGVDAFAAVCPVHVIDKWLEDLKPGEPIFPNTSYTDALKYIKDACKALGIKSISPPGTQSLRRGLLQTLETMNPSGAELLKVGHWTSSAINLYRDMRRSEEIAITNTFLPTCGADSDDDEAVCPDADASDDGL